MVPVRDRMASAAAARKGLSGSPSNSLTKRSATAPCLARIIGRVSAQLAQYADTLVLAALRRPNPPNPNGRDAERMTSSFCDGST